MIAMLAKMDGPRSLPLVGHTHMLHLFGKEIFNTFLQYGDRYTSPIAVEMGPMVYIFVYTPEQLQVVLNSPHCLEKPLQYSFFHVNRGIFSAPVDLWKILRKLITPSFGPGLLSSFVPIFNEKSSVMVEQMSKNVGKPQRDYYSEIVLCFMDTICNTAFGVDCDLQRSPAGAEYVETQEKYIDIVTERYLKPWQYLNFIYRFTNAYQIFKKRHGKFLALLTQATRINEVEDMLSKKSISKDYQDKDVGAKKIPIFVEKLLDEIQKSGHIKREDIDDHIVTMCFAGNDTTATTMSNILLMLAMHPDIQERVYQEIKAACPDRNQQVSIEDAGKLTYTEMVCKETMRHFSIAPVIGRTATQDVKLNDDITIPANSTLICCFYKLHMDPKNWGPDVKNFNPDNFLPDLVAKRHPYSFLPFSGGPRNCLGVRYAWLSMKIMLVHILRRYRLRTTLTMDTITVKFNSFMKIEDGCPITVEER